jgi:transcriptional regulator with XRE-family HTH domain
MSPPSSNESHPLTPSPGSPPVAEIWRRSGLRQAELARRAGLPRSVLNAYIHGARRPRSDLLARIAAAAGLELELAPRTPPVDAEEASRKLCQVLDLAEALPFRPREGLQFPGLPKPTAR